MPAGGSEAPEACLRSVLQPCDTWCQNCGTSEAHNKSTQTFCHVFHNNFFLSSRFTWRRVPNTQITSYKVWSPPLRMHPSSGEMTHTGAPLFDFTGECRWEKTYRPCKAHSTNIKYVIWQMCASMSPGRPQLHRQPHGIYPGWPPFVQQHIDGLIGWWRWQNEPNCMIKLQPSITFLWAGSSLSILCKWRRIQ